MRINYEKVLSEEFMEKNSDNLDWFDISRYQKLSEEFIERHSDKLNWFDISICQKLSEEFIEKYSDKVDWDWISTYQKLSKEFMEKFSDKFSTNYISHTIHYDESKRYNICSKCDCYMNVYIENCDSIIMQKALL
jgi:hypothetical protein